MGFDQGNISFRLCRLPEDLPADCLERFAAFAAPPLETVNDEPLWGWVSGRHLLDSKIDETTCRYGSYYHLCLRQAERKIPGSLLTAECRLMELTRMAETGSARISRKEKKSIKEEVTERLLPTMPPQLSGIYIALDTQEKILYTTATSPRQLELIQGQFNKAIGFEPVALTPETVASDFYEVDAADVPQLNISPELPDTVKSGTVGENFLTWLWFFLEERDGVLPPSKLGEFSMMLDGPLLLVAEGNGAFRSNISKGAPTVSAEAKAALTVGKKLQRAKLILARNKEEWQATIDINDFVFKGMKLPEGEAMDPVAIFEERMNNIYIFHTVFFALYQRFLGEMGNPEAVAAYQSKAKEWVRNRDGK